MKKTLFNIAFVAIAATLALSCAREVSNSDFAGNVRVLTFTSERPQIENPTRTQWNGETVVWSQGDKIRVGYTLNDNWMGASEAGTAKLYASGDVSIDQEDATIGTFTVPISAQAFTDPEVEGEYVFYALYPSSSISSATAADAPEVSNISLPSTQTPLASSFDKGSDIMVGKTGALSLSGFPTEPIEIVWNRVVAHADITFSNMHFDGVESINSIKLTANEEAKLTGTFTANLSTGETSTATSNEIFLNGTNLTANETSIEVFCSVLPVTFTSLDVEIKTDKATYTRSISGISKTFKRNARNTLTINMDSATRTDDAPGVYELFDRTLVEGDYIIYDATDGHAMKAEIASNRFTYSAVTPVDGAITTNDATIIWHIAPSDSYFTIYNASVEKYAAATGSNNQGQLLENGADDRSLWTVDGSYDFINKGRNDAGSNNKYLRSNGDYGFACYGSGTGHTLQLYAIDNRTPLDAPATVTASLNSSVNNAINVTFSTVTNADTYVITATPATGTPVIKSVDSSPATVDGLVFNMEYTISVYAVPASSDNLHKDSSATTAASTVTTGSAPEGYVLISSPSEATSGLYVIAAKIGDNYIGLPNTLGTSPFAGSSVTVNNGVISTANAAPFSVRITKGDDNKYTITGGNQTLGYGSSTSFSLSATGNAAKWTIAAGSYGSFRIANAGTNTRAIVYRTGTTNKFGAYSTGNINGTEYYDVELFKFSGTVKEDANISVSPSSINLEVGDTQQLTVTTSSNGAKSYESSDSGVATVSNTGLVTAVSAGTATITVSTAETSSYYAGTLDIAVTVTNGPTSIADVISASTNASVYTSGVVAQIHTKGFIITDGSDNINVYQNGTPTVALGQAVTVSGTRNAYNSVAQISSPTINLGATGQSITRTSLSVISSSNATGFTTSDYVSLTGTLTYSNNYYNVSISGSSVKGSLYNVASDASFTGGTLSSMVGKMVIVTGYVTGSSNSYLYIAPVDIEEDNTIPTLAVSPSSLSWAATEYGSSNGKTIAVTLNGAASAGYYSISGSNSDWTVSKSGNTITVYPNAANTSTSTAKSTTLTITHTGDPTVYQEVICTQAKVEGAKYTYSFTISPDDFNGTSYAANNNEKTTTAVCTTDNTKTLDVKWTSYQIMKQGSIMQWQKNSGYLFNSTDLGTIKSVTVNSTDGSYTKYYGTSEHPTSGTTVGNGFFTVKVGDATGKTSSVVIVFEK